MKYIRPSHLALAMLAGTLTADPANAWPTPSAPSVSVRPNVSINPNIPRPADININRPSSGGSGGDGGNGNRPRRLSRDAATDPVEDGKDLVGKVKTIIGDPRAARHRLELELSTKFFETEAEEMEYLKELGKKDLVLYIRVMMNKIAGQVPREPRVRSDFQIKPPSLGSVRD